MSRLTRIKRRISKLRLFRCSHDWHRTINIRQDGEATFKAQANFTCSNCSERLSHQTAFTVEQLIGASGRDQQLLELAEEVGRASKALEGLAQGSLADRVHNMKMDLLQTREKLIAANFDSLVAEEAVVRGTEVWARCMPELVGGVAAKAAWKRFESWLFAAGAISAEDRKATKIQVISDG